MRADRKLSLASSQALSLVLLLVLSAAGCGTRTCKSGTLLVELTLDATTSSADTLTVQVTADGKVGTAHDLAHANGSTHGTIEVDFPGYPVGKSVSVDVTAKMGGVVLGENSNARTLVADCSVLSLMVGATMQSDGGSDLARDLSMPIDQSVPDAAEPDLSVNDLANADLTTVADLTFSPDLFGFKGCYYPSDCPSTATCNNSVCVETNDTVGLGSGKDGPYTTGGIPNTASTLAASRVVGATNLFTNDVMGLNNGDVVMVWQPGGMPPPASGGGPTTITGTTTGLWEIVATTGSTSTTVNLATPLRHAYPANVTQVLRVPQYTTVSITSTIDATNWNPATHTGGIVAFLATGTVTVTSHLNAIGAGFRGGAITSANWNGTDTCFSPDVATASGSSQTRGEGVAGNADGVDNATKGFGNVANGGGAGNCSQNGGGGGGNAGSGGVGGSCVASGFRFPGEGGKSIVYDKVSASSYLIMGGGGGAGDQTNSHGSSGGDGGGVIWFRAASLNGTGIICADGITTPSGASDGEGGGGAGGTIYMRLASPAPSFCTNGLISANGGDGTDATAASGTGAGAGGGGGRIFLQAGASCVVGAHVTVGGGAAGGNGLVAPGPADDGSQELLLPGPYCSSAGGPACSGTTPFCDTAINSCVVCRDGNDCSVSAPSCINHVCM